MTLYARPTARFGEQGMSVSLPIFIHRSNGFKRAVGRRRAIRRYLFDKSNSEIVAN
jgi:hypothetical protein